VGYFRRAVLVRARRRLSITTKFTLAFVALLLLIGIVVLTVLVSLKAGRNETQNAINIGIDTADCKFMKYSLQMIYKLPLNKQIPVYKKWCTSVT
jgi:hypothetical protein